MSYAYAVICQLTTASTDNAMRRASRHRNANAAGYSLLELVMAVALVGGTLVPALELVRDATELSLETDERMLLTNYAVSTLEQQIALVAATWASGDASGDFAADGHANLRWQATRSDASADGGIVGSLMHVQVTTYIDSNADDVFDATELHCDMRTKIGKIATYEAIATP